MAATTFNPLAAARELKAAGIEAEHAEAIAEGMREAADAAAGADRAELATKADLDELRRETKADLAELRAASRRRTAAARLPCARGKEGRGVGCPPGHVRIAPIDALRTARGAGRAALDPGKVADYAIPRAGS